METLPVEILDKIIEHPSARYAVRLTSRALMSKFSGGNCGSLSGPNQSASAISRIYPRLNRLGPCVAAAAAGNLELMLEFHAAGFPLDDSAITAATIAGHGHFIDWVMTLSRAEQYLFVSADVIAASWNTPDKIYSLVTCDDICDEADCEFGLLLSRAIRARRMDIISAMACESCSTMSEVVYETLVNEWIGAISCGETYPDEIISALTTNQYVYKYIVRAAAATGQTDIIMNMIDRGFDVKSCSIYQINDMKTLKFLIAAGINDVAMGHTDISCCVSRIQCCRD